MTPTKIHEALCTAFRTNNAEQMGNLGYHMEQGTHVCCGWEAKKFTDGKGGGCPARLSSTREVLVESITEESHKIFWNFQCATMGGLIFIEALKIATQSQVYAAAKQVLQERKAHE